MTTVPLLLIDLDGVLVFEATPPQVPRRELLLLHRELDGRLQGIKARKFVLTHRSRREAGAILAALRLDATTLEGCLAAEDLFGAAWREGGARGLLAGGLRKSAIIGELEQRLGIGRKDFAFVDDNLLNVEGMLAHGIGLGLLAPTGWATESSLASFSWEDARAAMDAWRRGSSDGLVRLGEETRTLETWQFSGIHTAREARRLFNGVRVAGRHIRRALRRAP